MSEGKSTFSKLSLFLGVSILGKGPLGSSRNTEEKELANKEATDSPSVITKPLGSRSTGVVTFEPRQDLMCL